nr:MAG TPA: hypothetical protein [Bacteriophage sp.]
MAVITIFTLTCFSSFSKSRSYLSFYTFFF